VKIFGSILKAKKVMARRNESTGSLMSIQGVKLKYLNENAISKLEDLRRKWLETRK